MVTLWLGFFMAKFDDKTGKKFNMLTVKKYLGGSKWLCKCDCGNECIVASALLNEIPGRLKVKSCGCLREKNLPEKEDFFENIDSESKAYILGFIASDGCVQPELNRVKIDLKDSDEDILRKIQNEIGHKNNLSRYSQEIDIGDKHYTAHTSRLVISSKKMVEDLKKYGVVKNKSNILDVALEKIPDDFFFDYLRGVIDGDGCISFAEGGTCNLTITTSTIMAEHLNKEIERLFGQTRFYLTHRHKDVLENATLQATNKHFIYQILNQIYGEASIYLDRKYNKYLEYKKYYENRIKKS
jgi:hypothetical protein